MQQKYGSCFQIHSLISVYLLMNLKIILKVISEQNLLFPSIFIIVLGSCSFDLLFCDYIFLVISWIWLTSKDWNFSSSAFFRTEIIDSYWFNLSSMWNYVPTDYGWYFFWVQYFIVISIESQSLYDICSSTLTLTVFIKSIIIFMGLLSYDTWYFALIDFLLIVIVYSSQLIFWLLYVMWSLFSGLVYLVCSSCSLIVSFF